MHVREFQGALKRVYGRRDKKRGLASTFVWFVEEVGELAKAIREGDRKQCAREIADTLAWLFSVANMLGIDIEKSLEKYAERCPKCLMTNCTCTYDAASFRLKRS